MSAKSLEDLIAERLDQLPDRYPTASPASPIRSTKKAAQWSAGIYRAYSYLSGRAREPWQKADLDRQLTETLEGGADFLKLRANAAFAPVRCVAYSEKAAAEIMKQAREIERETYARRDKWKHGGSIGRTAMQLLEWFCFVMWPKARYGMFPSLAHIANGARMSKQAVVDAMKVLQLHGFLTVQPRRKRVQGAFGVKVVQDTNAYVLNLARGLGALALAVFGKKPQRSESTRPAAKEIIPYSSVLAPETITFFDQFEASHSTA